MVFTLFYEAISVNINNFVGNLFFFTFNVLRRNSFDIEYFVNDEKSTLHSTVDKTVFPLFDNYYRLLKSFF